MMQLFEERPAVQCLHQASDTVYRPVAGGNSAVLAVHNTVPTADVRLVVDLKDSYIVEFPYKHNRYSHNLCIVI